MVDTIIDSVPSLLRGLMVTLQITISSLFIGFIFGIIISIIRVFGKHIFKSLAVFYINVVRSIPTIVFVLIFYLIIQEFINVSPMLSVILALGIHSSAYQAEILRGAFGAVSKGEIKAGQALGLSNFQIFRSIVFKQMMIHAIPAGSNEITIVLKETSIAFVAGVTEMFRQADIIASTNKDYLLMYIIAAIFYFIITYSTNKFFARVEQRFSLVRG